MSKIDEAGKRHSAKEYFRKVFPPSFSTKRIDENEVGVYDEMTNFVAGFATQDAADRAALALLHDPTLADDPARLRKLPFWVW